MRSLIADPRIVRVWYVVGCVGVIAVAAVVIWRGDLAGALPLATLLVLFHTPALAVYYALIRTRAGAVIVGAAAIVVVSACTIATIVESQFSSTAGFILAFVSPIAVTAATLVGAAVEALGRWRAKRSVAYERSLWLQEQNTTTPKPNAEPRA